MNLTEMLEDQPLQVVFAHAEDEIARLRKDQEDWRKGVALIASALGETEPTDLSCVRLSEAVLELRAECERLRDELSRAAVMEGELREAARDALSGWLYIQEFHGRLYGVGWDRVELKLKAALSTPSPLADAIQEVLEAVRLTANAARELDKGEEPTRWAFELMACQETLLKAEDRYRALLEGREED